MRTDAGSPHVARRTILLLVVAILVVALLGAVLFVEWDRHVRTASPANPGTVCPLVIKGGNKPPLAARGVDRVALIGDSIMYQPSCAIAESLAKLGITTSRYAVSGTGLLNGSVNWITRTKQIMASNHPDIVVAIFVGNYPPPPVRDAQGHPIVDDTPAFFAAWQARARELSQIVHRGGASMYWVSPPPIAAIPPLGHAQKLFDGYRTIAGDHFLESGDVLRGPHDSAPAAMMTCHHKRVVRSPLDGVHLTDDGARIYGQQIAHDLSARIGVLTAPKPC
jgi:hypothetical protein